jgi:hypothetical protein
MKATTRSRPIRIDDTVWRAIQAKARPGETPNRTLRRVLRLGKPAGR